METIYGTKTGFKVEYSFDVEVCKKILTLF